MTDAIETIASAPPRHRLLRFLLPVLLLHALLLASLPFWPEHDPAGRRAVDVELAPAAPAVLPVRTTLPSPVSQQQPTAPPIPQPAKRVPASSPVTARQVTQPSAIAPPAPIEMKQLHAASAAPAQPAPLQGSESPAPQHLAAEAEDRTARQTWRDDYRRALRNALVQYHHYPPKARRFGLSGVVEVGFAIRHDGVFEDIHVVHSSHAQLLDQAALDTVRHLGRFRPLPDSYSEDSWALSVPLVYRLD